MGRPNVLILLTDDLPAHMAYGPNVMPKMHERVFAWGAKFDRASCHVVLCGQVTTAIYSCKTHRRTIVDRDRPPTRGSVCRGRTGT